MFGVEPADEPTRYDPRRSDPRETVRQLAEEIGARPATSIAEAKSAAYMDARMRRAGLQVAIETFETSAGRGYDVVLLSLLAFGGAVLFYWAPLAAVVLLAASGVLLVLHDLRVLPPLTARRARSQNVIGTRATRAPYRTRLVLLAPLDTAPATPLVMRRIVLLRAVFAVLALLAALIGNVEVQRSWWYLCLAISGALLLLALIEPWLLARFPAMGAVAHAGALAALVAAVERAGRLERTELWVVALGAHTMGAGLADLLRRYPFDGRTLFVGVEHVGRGGLCVVTAEGLLVPRPADDLLLRIAAAAGAAPRRIIVRRSSTLGGSLLRQGRRALTITCRDAQGRLPLSSEPRDTPAQIESDVLDQAADLLVAVIQGVEA